MSIATAQNKPETRNIATRSRVSRTNNNADAITPVGIQSLQKKSVCTCGGGCPRCQTQALGSQPRPNISEANDPSIQRTSTTNDEAACESAEFPPEGVWFTDPKLVRIREGEAFMAFGFVGEAVALVQQTLDAWGCDEGLGYQLPMYGVDGIFGSETRAAVKNFQARRVIDDDGIVGPVMMGELDQVIIGDTLTCPSGTTETSFISDSQTDTMQTVCLPPGSTPTPLGKGCPTPSNPGPDFIWGFHQPADGFGFPGRSTTTYGVGEDVKLSFDSYLSKDMPKDKKAEPHGGLRWVLKSGPGNLKDIDERAGTAAFRAGFTVKNDEPVHFELQVLASPCKGSVVAKTQFKITRPTGAVMEQEPDTQLRHIENSWSIGFLGRVYLRPTTVSFQNVMFHEGTDMAKRDGWLHDITPEQHPDGPWLAVGAGDSTTGSRVKIPDPGDQVFSGKKSPNPTYGKGSFLWQLPWEFRLVGGTAVGTIVTVDQLATSGENGKATIEKHNAGPFSIMPYVKGSYYF